MGLPTYGAPPGIGAKVSSTPEVAVVWGPEEWRCDFNNLLVDSTAVDAGNTPTTELRPGLILGKKTSDSNLYQWDATAADGTEKIAGVLYRGISMLNENGVVEDKQAHVLLAGGLRVDDLLIKGTAFTSHADEHIARRQLSQRFALDDDLSAGARWLGVPLVNRLEAGTTLTPTTAQNGTRFILSNAASVTVTLPTLEAGLIYEFLRVGDEELVIASAEGDNMIVGNDDAADSLTFTTAGQHVGACVRVESIRYGATVRWLPFVQVVPFGTNNTGLAFAIAT